MGERTLPINIVCFLWGDWCAPYGVIYLNRLFNGIKRNTSLPFNFYCFTDLTDVKSISQIDRDIHLLSFNPVFRWNFNKMFMFHPIWRFSGQVFCFDLDVIITGNLDDILGYQGSFATCEAAYHGGDVGGSLVSFPAVKRSSDSLYRALFKPLVDHHDEYARRFKGSERRWYQSRLENIEFWQDLFPGQVRSYKVDCREGLPEDAKVVRFHGKPRPHIVDDNWVKENWR